MTGVGAEPKFISRDSLGACPGLSHMSGLQAHSNTLPPPLPLISFEIGYKYAVHGVEVTLEKKNS